VYALTSLTAAQRPRPPRGPDHDPRRCQRNRDSPLNCGDSHWRSGSVGESGGRDLGKVDVRPIRCSRWPTAQAHVRRALPGVDHVGVLPTCTLAAAVAGTAISGANPAAMATARPQPARRGPPRASTPPTRQFRTAIFPRNRTPLLPGLRGGRRRRTALTARRDEHGVVLPQLDLGGGFAVPYRPGDQEPDPAALAGRRMTVLRSACAF
jgi:hypothetical protein